MGKFVREKGALLRWVKSPGPVGPRLRIGLLGGSFNPAHSGHFYVSEVARKSLKLDYVWWLVTPGNPLKRASELADLMIRMAGAQAAARHPRIRVTDIESSLGTRFTVDTLQALQYRFPQACFVWLMGSDNLVQFARWKHWPRIAQLAPIAVVRRPGSALAPLKSSLVQRFGLVRRLENPPAILVLDGPRDPANSTAIREALEPRLPSC
jgi:nicotinate-nucleotide adenylyltransferase